MNNSGFSRIIYEAGDASLQLRNFYREISSPILTNISFKYVDAQVLFCSFLNRACLITRCSLYWSAFLQVDTETVTKKTFDYFFRGTELVVAGKVKNTESKINTTLHANSFEGIFNDSTFMDIPIFSPVTQVEETRQIGNCNIILKF